MWSVVARSGFLSHVWEEENIQHAAHMQNYVNGRLVQTGNSQSSDKPDQEMRLHWKVSSTVTLCWQAQKTITSIKQHT